MAKIGRPRKKASDRKSDQMSVRLNRSLRDCIERAAREEQQHNPKWTLTDEMTKRLEKSFESGKMTPLDEFVARPTYDLLLLIGAALARLGVLTDRRWHFDPFTHQEASHAIAMIMESVRPDGRARSPAALKKGVGRVVASETVSKMMAAAAMRESANLVPADKLTRMFDEAGHQLSQYVRADWMAKHGNGVGIIGTAHVASSDGRAGPVSIPPKLQAARISLLREDPTVQALTEALKQSKRHGVNDEQ